MKCPWDTVGAQPRDTQLNVESVGGFQKKIPGWAKKSEKEQIQGTEADHPRDCQQFSVVNTKCKPVGSGQRCGFSGTMGPSHEGPWMGAKECGQYLHDPLQLYNILLNTLDYLETTASALKHLCPRLIASSFQSLLLPYYKKSYIIRGSKKCS